MSSRQLTASCRPAAEGAEAAAPISVLTGATGGIGALVAEKLAAAGHSVVLPGRRPEALQALCEDLRERTGNPRVFWVQCDLASLDSVREAAAVLTSCLDRVDVLVNCAGRFAGAYEETGDGFESHLGVNYLAPFLLTHLLLPLLEAADAPRIVNVAGETARFSRLRLDDLNRRRRYSVLGAYGQSKLALVMFSRLLAERVGPRIAVNALQPAMAATGHLSAGPRWLDRLWRTLAPGPALGARAVARLALRPAPQGKSRRYYIGRWWAPAPFAAYNRERALRLYAESARLVGLDAGAWAPDAATRRAS